MQPCRDQNNFNLHATTFERNQAIVLNTSHRGAEVPSPVKCHTSFFVVRIPSLLNK